MIGCGWLEFTLRIKAQHHITIKTTTTSSSSSECHVTFPVNFSVMIVLQHNLKKDTQ